MVIADFKAEQATLTRQPHNSFMLHEKAESEDIVNLTAGLILVGKAVGRPLHSVSRSITEWVATISYAGGNAEQR